MLITGQSNLKNGQDSHSVIQEEAIESSISNIEMSKSEKSLQKPLKLAVSKIPDSKDSASMAG